MDLRWQPAHTEKDRLAAIVLLINPNRGSYEEFPKDVEG